MAFGEAAGDLQDVLGVYPGVEYPVGQGLGLGDQGHQAQVWIEEQQVQGPRGVVHPEGPGGGPGEDKQHTLAVSGQAAVHQAAGLLRCVIGDLHGHQHRGRVLGGAYLHLGIPAHRRWGRRLRGLPGRAGRRCDQGQ